MWETWVRSPGGEDTLEKGMATSHPSVFLPGESHGGRSLVGTVHGVAKSRTQLSYFTFTLLLRARVCVCVCVCVCVLHLYPSWTCRSFPYFGCCNNAAVNTGVHIPFQIHVFLFFRQIPESFGLAKNVIQLFFYKMLWKTLNELFG